MGSQRQLQNLARHAHSDAARLAAQRKMYCVWFVAVVVPFAILFCLFPSSNRNYHRTSRLPASAKARLGSGDNAFRQQVIVEDSILTPLKQQERVESLSTKLGDRSTDRQSKNKADRDRKPKNNVEREPGEARSIVGFESRVREMDRKKSEIQGSAAEDWKKKRSNENANRKRPAKGLEKLRVEETVELGSIFGSSKESDGILNSRGSQKSKRFSADSLQSSDSAQGESDSIRATSKESAVSGPQKKKRKSEDLRRMAESADGDIDDVILRERSSTGSLRKMGRSSVDFSHRQQLTDRESGLILPEIFRNEEGRNIEEKPKADIRNSASVECDVFKGKWIPDNNGPGYANASCPWIDEDSQICMEDSILDPKYLQWRWRPAGCVLQRFNAKAFLKTMERKALAFVGDSLARGQARSLLCLLARVESPKSIYFSKENQSASWHFPSSNFTLTTVWSPFLVQETEDQINGAPDGVKRVRLDVVEPKWARLLPKLDAVVLSAGSWFLKPVAYVVKNRVVGCRGCGSALGVKELGLYSAYRAAARSAIIGVTTLPWYTGTTILQQTIMETPEMCTISSSSSSRYRKRRRKVEELSKKISEIQRDEFERAVKRGIPNKSRLELSETTTLTFQHPAAGNVTSSTSTSAGKVDFYCTLLQGCSTGPSLTWNQLLLPILRRPSMDVTNL